MKYFSSLLNVMNQARLMRIQKRHYFSLKKKSPEKTGILCINEETRVDQSDSKLLILFLFLNVHLLKDTVTARNEAPDAL